MKTVLALAPVLVLILVVSGCTQQGEACGDGFCAADENTSSCPSDCMAWCAPGEVWPLEKLPANIPVGEARILGPMPYEGDMRCHVEHSLASDPFGLSKNDLYYLDEEGDDVWYSLGNWVYHVVNGECVGGDCP